MKHEVNFATLRLGVMLLLLTLLLSMTLRLSLAQYPTMIPVTDELLTSRPTTQAKRVQEESGRSGEWLVTSEEGEEEDRTTETQRTQREESQRWIVLFRSICIGVLFVGSLVGMVAVLWRKSG